MLLSESSAGWPAGEFSTDLSVTSVVSIASSNGRNDDGELSVVMEDELLDGKLVGERSAVAGDDELLEFLKEPFNELND